jgi:hypothetical protein
MPTNNFGDNWLTDEEQNYWGVDSNGEPLKYEQKTERQLDNEYHLKRSRENFSFVVWMIIAGGIVLFWVWVMIAMITKAFGINLIG